MNLLDRDTPETAAAIALPQVPGATPPLCRTSLAPSRRPPQSRERCPWERSLAWRRAALVLLVVAPSAIMSWLFSGALPAPRGDPLGFALVVAFGLLFAWVAIWFWTATAGFLVLLFARAPRSAGSRPAPETGPGRIAVVMPVHQEDPALFAGALSSLYRGLEAIRSLERYDFYVLSDSADPDRWVAEEMAWLQLVTELDAAGRVFYRRRRSRIKLKSGNIADFCRRWGRNYAYMIVLDADSILAAEAAVELARRMDANPAAGIIQTFPQVVNQHTFYGRLQQFAAALYGRMFSAGLHFWQLGAGIYWGHNAIIRLRPFMDHCLLPRIRGGPLGGDILSHDFVEAALMRRAGYDVWIAYDLVGSYEETPECFAADVARDRRWARGNLQHLRLLGLHGVHGAHRAMFVAGAFSYVSSGVWLLFLVLGTAVMVQHAWVPPNYFPEAHSPFPQWPVWHRDVQIALIASAFGVLLLPKIFGALLALLQRGRRRRFGNSLKLAGGILIELLFSGLFAPARMLLHSFFVLAALGGFGVEWAGRRGRGASGGWRGAVRRHALGGLLGVLWLLLALKVSTTLFLWLLPVLAGLFLAPVLETLTGSLRLGTWLRQRGLLVIGEERATIPALDARRQVMQRFHERRSPGFFEVLRDPAVHAVHSALLRPHPLPRGPVRYERLALISRLIRYGASALDRGERLRLLYDQRSLDVLHRLLAAPQDCKRH